MTAKIAFMPVCLFIVPLLGLVSCSKDHPAQDTWEMSQPTVEAPGLQPMRVSAASERTLPGGAVLKFSGDPWTSLNASIKCDLKGQVFTRLLVLDYQPEILLKSFWPEELYSKLNEASLKESVCSLTFQATNANGSTQDFELNKIKLNSFAADTFQTRAGLSTMNVAASRLLSSSLLDDAVKGLGAHMSDQAELRMICGEKSASLTLLESVRTAHVVENLMNRLDLRGPQTCHFLAAEKLAELPGEKAPVKSLPGFEMTSDMTIRFPQVPLTVTQADVGSHILAMRRFEDQALMDISITNSVNEPGYILIPDAISTFRARLVGNVLASSGASYSSNGILEGTVELPHELNFSVSPASPVGSSNGKTTFRVDAFQTLVIHVRINPGPNNEGCFRDGFQGPIYIGFTYGLDQAFVIQQTDSPTSVETNDIFEIPSIKNAFHFPGSIIFDASQNEFGPRLTSTLLPRATTGTGQRPNAPCF